MESMRVAMDNLLELTHLSGNARQQRHIVLPAAAAEVVRQLRELARSRRVRIRLDESLPTVEVNAAAVELCLMNFVSNALKYADDAKPDPWVEITGRIVPPTEDSPAFVVVEVRDNGLGVPASQRDRLFERFFRAGVESMSGVEGTGLGLSIVRETVESLKGHAWADFPHGMSIFAFSLPIRRAEDLTPVEGVTAVSAPESR
jgi:signal transduction histidine kinase